MAGDFNTSNLTWDDHRVYVLLSWSERPLNAGEIVNQTRLVPSKVLRSLETLIERGMVEKALAPTGAWRYWTTE